MTRGFGPWVCPECKLIMRLWPDNVWRCLKCECTELHKQLWHYPSRTAIAKRSYELRHRRTDAKKKNIGVLKKRKLVPKCLTTIS